MSRVTLSDVRSEALDAIRQLKSKEIDVKTAAEIRGHLNVIIDTAKTEVEFIKALPDHIKKGLSQIQVLTIVSTLEDKDKALDTTLKEIKEKNKFYKPESSL